MDYYFRFDENGYFAEDFYASYGGENPQPPDVTDVPPPQPMYKVRWDGERWVETGGPPEPDIGALREAKLRENSEACRDLVVNGFVSCAKGDGMQPYRMNDDDQKNILGLLNMIAFGLMEDPTGGSLPMFEWKNANQIKCEADWHHTHIVRLFREYGVWKTAVLRRQDAIKEKIMLAGTYAEVGAVGIDYGSLLAFHAEGGWHEG